VESENKNKTNNLILINLEWCVIIVIVCKIKMREIMRIDFWIWI